MRINTNVSAFNTMRQLGKSNQALSETIGRLSSGFRINRASDDAAGLGIANKIRADIRSLQQASRNAEQANSLLQVAEGAAQTVEGILERMKELAAQAASDNVDSTGRQRLDDEFDSLRSEITRIVNTTEFQNSKLLDGSFGTSVDTNVANSTILTGQDVYSADLAGTSADTYTVTDQTGAANQLQITNTDGDSQVVTLASDGKQSVTFDQFGITLNLEDAFARNSDGSAGNSNTAGDVVVTGSSGSFMVSSSGSYSSHDLVTLSGIDLTLSTLTIDGANGDLTSASAAQTTLTNLDTAVGKVSDAFADVGAAQNRIDFASANVDITVENFQAAESVIRDADMAFEVSQMTRYQILQQAGTAVLAQANQTPQSVLSLLR
jgi:flagellin